uniref:Uncharacterized protein n=1 Tax=Cannabis sativa TaxID=3483 RepID=A0A803NMW4_CANSA
MCKDRDGVLRVLGLTSLTTHDKYLGLPMGLELLKCGLRRSICDGAQVWAFKDPWLPHPTSFKPIRRRIMIIVSEFILPSGARDVVKLQQGFLPMNVDIILSIPLARQAAKDGWCWHYDRDKVYNVKSGYLLACRGGCT